MEGRRLQKVLVIFISLLVLFSIFTFYLGQQYPHKAMRISVRLDQGRYKLDDINVSEVQLTLNNSCYSADFTNNTWFDPSDFLEVLEIIPNDNDNLVFFLIKDNRLDIFFIGWMEYEVRFPGGMGDFGKVEKILYDEMLQILGFLGLESLKNDIEFDYNFGPNFDLYNEIAFFFFLSVILIFTFLILYKRGLLIDKILDKRLSLYERDGLLLLFLGMIPFLVMLNELINAIATNDAKSISCCTIILIVAIVLILSGLFLVFTSDKRKYNHIKI